MTPTKDATDVARLRFLLIGHPVRHSVSPAMCNAAFGALDLPHVYTALDVPNARGILRIVEELRNGLFAGCNVTVPYKRAVLPHVDLRAPSAEEAGAANVLSAERGRIVAHNTDAEALAADLQDVWGERPRNRAAIIGSGGAALAALVACRRLGFKVVCMTSRSWIDSQVMFDAPSSKRARALGALTTPWPKPDDTAPHGKISQALRLQWSELTADADCVIQATSAGMTGADPGEDVSSIVAWSRLPAHAIAYDVVYNPRITPFLKSAHAAGLTAVDGLGMLVRQGALAIELWTGMKPPLDRMRDAAEHSLAAGLPLP
jgi:shikimate dehydrogenase